jgi:CheY-like chemotaxis protein
VEDSAPNRLLYKIYLEKQPLGIQFATTGHEALKHAATHVFDAMVVDLQLPDINGLTVIPGDPAQEAANRPTATPILVGTALAFREERHQAFEDGADALLTKPIPKNQFLAILGKLLRRDTSKSVSPVPDTWTTPPQAD